MGKIDICTRRTRDHGIHAANYGFLKYVSVEWGGLEMGYTDPPKLLQTPKINFFQLYSGSLAQDRQ